jgi:regulator of protease activity HflC (stomatin/prohibitin superfamily)
MFCIQCVDQGQFGIIENFGKFSGVAEPGVNCVKWPMESIAMKLSARVQELRVECETKTKDNVFVLVSVSVQYTVLKTHIYNAAYKLTNPQQQIRAYVFDVIRSTLPRMELDEAFENKETVAMTVKQELAHAMEECGFVILQALVTDLNPDARVRTAMNEINSSKRMRDAAAEKAEGEKIILVKAAEAEAESKYLSGVGVAKQRKAIVEGLRDSVAHFTDVDGTTPKDAITLLMVNQYFDMLESVGHRSNASTLFVAHEPSTVVGMKTMLTASLSQMSK